MTFEDYAFGFRVLGDKRNDRRLVDWPSAFLAYSQCDDRAEIFNESYLSAFQYGDAFREHLDRAGSTKNYQGATWSNWLWLDIDREDLDQATADVRRLASGLCMRYGLDGDELLSLFSGAKGFHVGLPLALCGLPEPSLTFHSTCKRLAETLAGLANVTIDTGVYDRVRLFRAPNSRHPKTNLHKRYLSFGELMGLATRRIVELAAEPEPFDLPDPPGTVAAAVDDWNAAAAAVDSEKRAVETRRRDGSAPSRLNRSTMDLIREPPTSGDRHRLLFSAAANLAEFGCSFELAFALLSESALDSGLSPSDVRRQIQCGLAHHKINIEL